MNKMKKRIKLGILFVPIFIGGVFLFSLLLMSLWNGILPAVLGVKAISFWQAMGIFALSKILFGFNHGWGGRRRQWKQGMEQRWSNMTPEEREQFQNEWKHRCGGRWGINSNTDASTTAAE